MEIEELRAATTVLSFIVFLAIVAWAYARGRSARFAQAAQLPFDDERDEQPESAKRVEGGR